jgi:hypothetical protein
MSADMSRICDARDAMTDAKDSMEKILAELSAIKFSEPLIAEWQARGKTIRSAEEMADRAYGKYTKLLEAMRSAIRLAGRVEQEIEAQRLVIKRTALEPTGFRVD